MTRLIQGAFGGALIAIVVGFNWGGWTLNSNVEKRMAEAEHKAVVRVLAPICADKFQQSAEVKPNLEALIKTESWKRNEMSKRPAGPSFPARSPTAAWRKPASPY